MLPTQLLVSAPPYCARIALTFRVLGMKIDSISLNIRLLENAQRRWTGAVADVSHLAYVERLKTRELFFILGRLLRADLIKF